MRITDLIEEIYWGLSANKVRSSLTMLGIMIGIASVIAMVAVGQGTKSSIQSSIESAGANLIIVIPGSQRGAGLTVSQGRGTAQTLTQSDADEIKKQATLAKAVAPELTRRYQITTKGHDTNTQVIGTVGDYPVVRNVQVENGVFIQDRNVQSADKVAVLGPTTRDDLFGVDGNAIGQFIRINNIEFKIVGVTKSKGGSGFNNPDDAVYIPLTTAQRYLAGDTYVSTISVSASDQSTMTPLQSQVTTILLGTHKISNAAAADFSVVNQADIVATASSVAGTFTTLLASIAAISLLVGGIGIMNMMLTTVTERTREIGLRQAIGAEETDISRQFLFEAVTLTVIGGVVGIILGWLATLAITKFTGTLCEITSTSVLLAFGVSGGIGIVFGYYPARRAAHLNPIEALRFE